MAFQPSRRPPAPSDPAATNPCRHRMSRRRRPHPASFRIASMEERAAGAFRTVGSAGRSPRAFGAALHGGVGVGASMADKSAEFGPDHLGDPGRVIGFEMSG